MRTSGPVVGHISQTLKASANSTSNIWCRQAIHSKFQPIDDSKGEHPPFIHPVFQEVVAKHPPNTSVTDYYDFRSSKTTSQAALPVPEVIFGSPMNFLLRSFNEVIRTESQSCC